MDLQLLENKYTRAIFTAAHDYILGYINAKPGINRIHVSAYTSAAKDKTIVYSIGPAACTMLQIDDNGVSFNARFKGVATDVFIPWDWVMFIYCPEFTTPFAPNLRDPYGLNIQYSNISGEGIADEEVRKENDDVLQKRSKMTVLPS